MHLAELNIAKLTYPLDDPRLEGFVANLDRINALAERMDGFVWRLKDETGHSTTLQAFTDPTLIVNMSVWRDVSSLEHFVWNTAHKQIYAKKAEWFSAMKMQHFVMWNITEGDLPTVDEAKQRLEHLDTNGNTDHAFNWSHLPHVKLWQTQRCG